MRDTDYAYCVARLRATESRMLSVDDFETLEKLSYEKAVDFLKKKKWIIEGNNISDFIKNQKKMLWTLLEESVPEKKELGVLSVLNDFFNIKTAVKCIVFGKDPEPFLLYPTGFDVKNLKEKLLSRDFDSAFGSFSDIAKEAYEISVKTKSNQHSDFIVDKAALECFLNYSENKNIGLAGEISSFFCDTTNIKIAFRCVKYKKDETFTENVIGPCSKLNRDALVFAAQKGEDELVSYLLKTKYDQGVNEYQKGIGEFEKWCDNEILKIASGGIFTSFGFSPVCLHYYRRMNEIKTVGAILRQKVI